MTEKNKQQQSPKISSSSTTERILDAAEQLFAEKSYEGTRLREIAARVGIREPSIYSHFTNKAAIYDAVIDRALSPFYQEINQWNRSDLTLRDINEIPRKLMELHGAHPYSAQLLHREFCQPLERINPKVIQWWNEIMVQSHQFMDGLPENEHKHIDRNKVIANAVALTNITLGVFSTQGIQTKLLADDYCKSTLFEEHVKVISKIFKSLVL